MPPNITGHISGRVIIRLNDFIEGVKSQMKDKIVFVTGASSGIGQACAKIFAQHGAKLILCARRKDRIDVLAEELKKKQ